MSLHKKISLRLLWILLQGVFLPLVYFIGKYGESSVGWVLFTIYMVLVFIDAVLTCWIFEPKNKARKKK